jgi:fatty-acyl-CoA synthase
MFQALLEALEEEPAVGLRRDTLRFMLTAGAAVSAELVLAFEKRNLVLKQAYGQTETSILCCLDARDAARKAGSVGHPVFHVELRIIAPETLSGPVERWRDVAVGEIGEIAVRGPITFLGYWNLPEATAETLRDGWVRTRDLASVDEEGFITLVARARDMYISGGENVYPTEVENTFAEHPAVREIAVIGIPDAKWGETGRAFVVPAENIEFDAEALLAWAGERLARFKLPSEFVVVDSLPRTASGKVQKHRLVELNSR